MNTIEKNKEEQINQIIVFPSFTTRWSWSTKIFLSLFTALFILFFSCIAIFGTHAPENKQHQHSSSQENGISVVNQALTTKPSTVHKKEVLTSEQKRERIEQIKIAREAYNIQNPVIFGIRSSMWPVYIFCSFFVLGFFWLIVLFLKTILGIFIGQKNLYSEVKRSGVVVSSEIKNLLSQCPFEIYSLNPCEYQDFKKTLVFDNNVQLIKFVKQVYRKQGDKLYLANLCFFYAYYKKSLYIRDYTKMHPVTDIEWKNTISFFKSI